LIDETDRVIQILQILGNPIRKRIIRALGQEKMRFTELMSACSLNYDHDAGHFNYHLSDLVQRNIVEKKRSYYFLTDQGQKLAEMIVYLDKESSYLFPQLEKGDADKMKTDLVTKWASQDKTRFKQTPGGPLPDLIKDIKKMVPETTKQKKIIRFVKSTLLNPDQKVLQVFEGDNLQGWVILTAGVDWHDTKGENGKTTYSPITFLTTDYLMAGGWVKNRKEVAKVLLDELLRKADEIGTDFIQFSRISPGDIAIIQALQEKGFERISTNYTMQRALDPVEGTKAEIP
jgi:DNA-binding HxlR family transcriptional regulator